MIYHYLNHWHFHFISFSFLNNTFPFLQWLLPFTNTFQVSIVCWFQPTTSSITLEWFPISISIHSVSITSIEPFRTTTITPFMTYSMHWWDWIGCWEWTIIEMWTMTLTVTDYSTFLLTFPTTRPWTLKYSYLETQLNSNRHSWHLILLLILNHWLHN